MLAYLTHVQLVALDVVERDLKIHWKVDVNQNEFLDKLCYENGNPLSHPLKTGKLRATYPEVPIPRPGWLLRMRVMWLLRLRNPP